MVFLKKIMRFIPIVLFIVILIQLALNIYLNNPTSIAKKNSLLKPQTPNYIFDVIYMNLFPVAEVELKKEEQRDTFLLKASARPIEILRKSYDAGIQATSLIKKETLLPLSYEELIHTPEEDKIKIITFDHKNNIAEREGVKIKIPAFTYDPLSALFTLFNHKFVLNEKIIINLLSKKEIYELKTVTIGFKDNIYKIKGEVYRQDKSSSHGAKFTMWIREDKTPLLIKVTSPAGIIYLRLKNIK